jgi:hypothetical protein
MNSFVVKDGWKIPEVRVKTGNVDSSVEVVDMLLRSLGIDTEHDFDRMADRVRIWTRTVPFSSLSSSGVSYLKRAIIIDLPQSGTPERDGANMVLNALADFIKDHRQ